MAKVFTIPALPKRRSRRGDAGEGDPKYIEGQRLLVEAMRYLAKSDPRGNRPAIDLLFDHFQNQFRISDKPMQQ